MIQENDEAFRFGRKSMSIKSYFSGVGVAAFVMLSGSAVLAHHSFAMFDNSRRVEVVGKVSAFEWINPHVWLHVEAPDASGAEQEWSFEAGSPNQLMQSGWSPGTIVTGEEIKVVFHPLKDGSNGGQLLEITKSDGATLCQGAECRAR